MEYNDYELVYLAQERNEDAIELLYQKYYKLINNSAKKAFNYLNKSGLELEDVILEAKIGFEEAILGYNQDDSTIFFSFAKLCIDRQLKSLLLKYSGNKHKFLNEALTLDWDVNEDGMGLYNVLGDNNTPESKFFNKANVSEICDAIRNSLTNLEKYVFDLKLTGFSYSEISDILCVENKNIYNAITRVRNKVNKIINK